MVKFYFTYNGNKVGIRRITRDYLTNQYIVDVVDGERELTVQGKGAALSEEDILLTHKELITLGRSPHPYEVIPVWQSIESNNQ